jgi:hypothetical protein
MAGESEKDAGHDQSEALIDELIREIMNESGVSPESSARGRGSAALLETALASTLSGSKTSALERLLLVEAFGSALADALAPAVAELLAPRLMKYLEQVMTSESSRKGPGRTASPSGAGGGRRQAR